MADSPSMTEEPETEFPRMQIGDDLWIEWVEVAQVREQDINAQQMSPRHFDRLTENIRIRGQLESLPYCHQPGGSGTISVISGHHRTRAARAAGLHKVPAIVDYRNMSPSTIIAKQIAHNELHGEPDEEILRQLVAALTDVDDMLITGLDEDYLPTVAADDTHLTLPAARFDWRTVVLVFLPAQIERIEELATLIGASDDVWAADRGQFEEFSRAMVRYGRTHDIKSMATVVDEITRIALREAQQKESAAEAMQS